MNDLEIKDYIVLVVINTFHTEVTLAHIWKGDHIYRHLLSTVREAEIKRLADTMIADGDIELHEGEYAVTPKGHRIFAAGGYETEAIIRG